MEYCFYALFAVIYAGLAAKVYYRRDPVWVQPSPEELHHFVANSPVSVIRPSVHFTPTERVQIIPPRMIDHETAIMGVYPPTVAIRTSRYRYPQLPPIDLGLLLKVTSES
jgi:hypothetical protein